MSHSYLNRRSAAVAATVVLTLASLAAAAEGRFERTLTVSGSVTLSVMTGSGRISVQPGADGQVRVVATMKASEGWGWGDSGGMSPEAAIKAIEANPPIEQQGSVIRIGDMKDRPEGKNVSISYELVVPRATSLTSKSGSGSQVIGDIAGPLQASTGSGSLELGRIAGDTKASAGSGSITVNGTVGKSEVSTGSGSIELRAADGPVSARSGSGSIVVSSLGHGDVQATTGSGGIRARGVKGAFTASSGSGSIEIDGTPTGAWTVSSASGGITIALPAAASFVLDASSSSGHIDTDFPVTTTEWRRRALKGTVGTGGPVVKASTASGSIKYLKAAR
jgi:hypothetical protein